MLRRIYWRYGVIHFEGGAQVPFPEDIDYPGRAKPAGEIEAKAWETVTLDELVPPEVRELLRGA